MLPGKLERLVPSLQRRTLLGTERHHHALLLRQFVSQCNPGPRNERVVWHGSVGNRIPAYAACRCKQSIQRQPARHQCSQILRTRGNRVFGIQLAPSAAAMTASCPMRQLIVRALGYSRARSCTIRQRSNEVYSLRNVSLLDGAEPLLFTVLTGVVALGFAWPDFSSTLRRVDSCSWLPFTSSPGSRHCIATGAAIFIAMPSSQVDDNAAN